MSEQNETAWPLKNANTPQYAQSNNNQKTFSPNLVIVCFGDLALFRSRAHDKHWIVQSEIPINEKFTYAQLSVCFFCLIVTCFL